MESTDHADVQPPLAIFKKRGAKANTNLRKRPAPEQRPAKSDDTDDDSEFSSSEDDAGHSTKRRRKGKAGLVSASTHDPATQRHAADLGATVFTADRAVPITSTNDATKQTNWHDGGEGHSAAVRGKSQQTVKISAETVSEGSYKGLANKTTFVQKNPNAPNRAVGPIKAPTNIRTITITDYAPDVCKDYKKTGFCGFGDNCKYLHTREAYAAGWQLDKEWEMTAAKGASGGKKGNAAGGGGGTVVASADRSGMATEKKDRDPLGDAEDAMLKDIPFACIICQETYRDPIVTRCGHYFCERCALQRYRRDPTCAACGAGTNGVFNGAKRLKKMLERKREREEAAKEGI